MEKTRADKQTQSHRNTSWLNGPGLSESSVPSEQWAVRVSGPLRKPGLSANLERTYRFVLYKYTRTSDSLVLSALRDGR